MRVAVVQINSNFQKESNLSKVMTFLAEAVKNSARMIALPEVFNYRGLLNTPAIRDDVFESIPGPSTRPLVDFCKKKRVAILAGSVYERSRQPGKAYNTSILINQKGEIVAKYRKKHLFDAEVGGKKIRETQIFLPGNRGQIFDIKPFRFGMSICFDLRFPEQYRDYAAQGCHVFCIPSAFTQATGKSHWRPLLQARAIENLSYVVAPNQSGGDERGGVCFGHSMIISPWGEIVAEASAHREEILYADLDLSAVISARKKVSGVILRKKYY